MAGLFGSRPDGTRLLVKKVLLFLVRVSKRTYEFTVKKDIFFLLKNIIEHLEERILGSWHHQSYQTY